MTRWTNTANLSELIKAAQLISCVNIRAPAVDITISHLLKLSPNIKQIQPRTKHTVSSLHIEWIWVPNITAVKVKNRRPSRHRKINRMTVIGGEKSLHSVNKRKWVDTGHQSTTNSPNSKISACFAHKRILTVPAPGRLPGGSAPFVTGTFTVHQGEEEVSPFKQKFTPPFPGHQFLKSPYYPKFPLRLYLCINVLIKMQLKPEKKRGMCTYTREVHAGCSRPPWGGASVWAACMSRAGHVRPVCTALTFSHASCTPHEASVENTRQLWWKYY